MHSYAVAGGHEYLVLTCADDDGCLYYVRYNSSGDRCDTTSGMLYREYNVRGGYYKTSC